MLTNTCEIQPQVDYQCFVITLSDFGSNLWWWDVLSHPIIWSLYIQRRPTVIRDETHSSCVFDSDCILILDWTWNVVITSCAITLGCNYDTKILSFSCRLSLKHQWPKWYFCHQSLKLCWFQVVQNFQTGFNWAQRLPLVHFSCVLWKRRLSDDINRD